MCPPPCCRPPPPVHVRQGHRHGFGASRDRGCGNPGAAYPPGGGQEAGRGLGACAQLPLSAESCSPPLCGHVMSVACLLLPLADAGLGHASSPAVQRAVLRHVHAGAARALPPRDAVLGPQQRGAARLQPADEPHTQAAAGLLGRRGQQWG